MKVNRNKIIDRLYEEARKYHVYVSFCNEIKSLMANKCMNDKEFATECFMISSEIYKCRKGK